MFGGGWNQNAVGLYLVFKGDIKKNYVPETGNANEEYNKKSFSRVQYRLGYS